MFTNLKKSLRKETASQKTSRHLPSCSHVDVTSNIF